MTERCPHCGSRAITAEFIDIGVGYQQVTPFHCTDCLATQMNPYHGEDNARATPREKALGWWEGVKDDLGV